ncbi:MAG: signal recognition particle-docking protein FtsY [Candidatus Zixiibacteriota bacterium]|nr:MAG: signal recognition particle-docking protein FtsY [candidate division Zixibacteria bacterium]
MFGAFDKLKSALSKTKDNIIGKVANIVSKRKIDDDLLEEIEETLIEADIGVQATMKIIDNLKRKAKEQKLTEGEDILNLLKDEITNMLTKQKTENSDNPVGKTVIWLIVGVNGVGKTTTIGKLATYFTSQGKKVAIAACDTFRAAAIDQITIWAEKSNVGIIKSQEGSDPAAVAFDAAKSANARNIDILLVDTAGRLHTKSNLMEELKKIKRVVLKAAPDALIYSKLIIDGSTGQNALNQVKVFTDAVGCDGLIITKLDGTAKGGVLIAISEELNVPVDFIGIGESVEDLQKFNPNEYAQALFQE